MASSEQRDYPSSNVILHDFRNRAFAEGQHRRAARHRLDHDETERLRPVDREQQGERLAEKFALGGLVDLADEFNAGAVEQRLDP